MTDTLPLWFWVPVAVVLWTIVIATAIRWHRGRMAEIRAEADEFDQ